MSISQKFTIETVTIVTAVAILALVFSGMLGGRVAPGDGPLTMEKGSEHSQSAISGMAHNIQVDKSKP